MNSNDSNNPPTRYDPDSDYDRIDSWQFYEEIGFSWSDGSQNQQDNEAPKTDRTDSTDNQSDKLDKEVERLSEDESNTNQTDQQDTVTELDAESSENLSDQTDIDVSPINDVEISDHASIQPDKVADIEDIEDKENIESDEQIPHTQNSKTFPRYPLIDLYLLGDSTIEIIEADYDNTDPYKVMPYCEITDDGVIQVFFEKGTFTKDYVMPELRCFDPDLCSDTEVGRIDGPLEIVKLDYPLGYYNIPDLRLEYQLQTRISPEHILSIQGTKRQLDWLQKELCTPIWDDEYDRLDEGQVQWNYYEFAKEISLLTDEQWTEAFTSGEYDMVHYLVSRLKGYARYGKPLLEKLQKNYKIEDDKLKFNFITGELVPVQPLDKSEEVSDEAEFSNEGVPIEVIDKPEYLPVTKYGLHPIANKLSRVMNTDSDNLPWELFEGVWMPPSEQKKEGGRIEFKPLKPNMGVRHNQSSTEFEQIKIYDPADPGYKATKRKEALQEQRHPLGLLFLEFLKRHHNRELEPSHP